MQYVYDEAGNVLKRTILGADGECLEMGFDYDFKDRLTRRTNHGGAILRYFYDRNDKLSKAISPYAYEQDCDDGAGTTYAYDSRGNRIRVANALGETVQETVLSVAKLWCRSRMKKINNAQTIKGNQAEVEPYACLVPLLHISMWEAFIGRYR